jgi:hypothetical protein
MAIRSDGSTMMQPPLSGKRAHVSCLPYRHRGDLPENPWSTFHRSAYLLVNCLQTSRTAYPDPTIIP